MEVEDYFLRKLQESAIQPNDAVSHMRKQLKGYLIDGDKRGLRAANDEQESINLRKLRKERKKEIPYKEGMLRTSGPQWVLQSYP